MTDGSKILLADDDPTILRYLTQLLAPLGYRLSQANDGAEALRQVHSDCPHILITDWQMPNLDGLELCRRIRAERLPHYLYILMVTARSSSADLIQALDAGADDFVSKPFVPGELLARLRSGQRLLTLERELRQIATTDTVTGLPTRRVFTQVLERQWRSAVQSQRPLSCVIFDLDYFKRLNDSHGHACGDAMLVAVGEALAARCDPNHFVCRYGGEEFCALLSDTDEVQAEVWANQARDDIRSLRLTSVQGSVQTTASAGVAQRFEDVLSPAELVHLADQALLVAKRTGRDRTIRFGSLVDFAASASSRELSARPFEGVVARQVMTTPVHCLEQDAPLVRAADLLLRLRIHSAPVVDREGRLVGILSEQDLVHHFQSASDWDQPVTRCMHRNVAYYDEETPAQLIYDFLCRVSIRRVVIVRHGRPTGVVSRGSLLRWFGNWGVLGAAHQSRRDRAEVAAARERARNSLMQTAAAICQHTQALEQRLSDGTDNSLPEIVDKATKIQELVNDMLAFSQVDQQFHTPVPQPAPALDGAPAAGL